MSTREDGGPAFPVPKRSERDEHEYDGMTLRDYFAAKAMQAMVIAGNRDAQRVEYAEPILADDAYAIADAMLEVRDSE